MRHLNLHSATLFLLLLVSCSSMQRSSVIPERREFPVDKGVSACQDFYAYACNPVIDTFKLREDRSRHIFSFSDAHERILDKKKAYLASLEKKQGLSKRAQELSDVFVACNNKQGRAQEEKALVEAEKKKMAALKTRSEFLTFMAKQVISPNMSLLSFSRAANQDNSDWFDLFLGTGGLMTLPERSYYENKALIKEYRALLVEFFKTAQMDSPEKRADWVLSFETDFAKSYPLPQEIRQLYNTKMMIGAKDFVLRYPNFKLKYVLNKIPARTKIRHFLKDNYQWLNKRLGEADLEQLKSLYLWGSVSSYLDDAYPEFYKKKFDFNHKYLGGPPQRPVRKERCTKLVMGQFSKEIDAEMIDILFPNFPLKRFEAMVYKIREAMVRRLEANTWLSDEGKKAALKKMRSTKMQLVRPRNDREWDFLPYADYSPATPIANSKLRSTRVIGKMVKEFGKKRDKTKWSYGPLTINAYYSPPDHKFVMLQGILQYPFYDPTLPDVVNMGAAGMVVGHELGHAIDDQGSKYDHLGRLKQWMSAKDLELFKQKASVLIRQYDAEGHNGNLTQGENIADVTGLSFSFEAAFPGNKGSLEDKKAFFLQYGRLWCGRTRPAEFKRRLKTDPHAQSRTRVNLPIKHQDGFYQAYGCKAGDGMYLDEKERMKIW